MAPGDGDAAMRRRGGRAGAQVVVVAQVRVVWPPKLAAGREGGITCADSQTWTEESTAAYEVQRGGGYVGLDVPRQLAR